MQLKNILKLKKGLEELYDKHLPIKLSFSITKNLKIINEYEDFFEKERIKLINYYGQRDDKDNLIVKEDGSVKINNLSKFLEELDELSNSEQKFDITKVSMDIIEKCEDNNYDLLTLKQIDSIEWMIDTEE